MLKNKDVPDQILPIRGYDINRLILQVLLAKLQSVDF